MGNGKATLDVVTLEPVHPAAIEASLSRAMARKPESETDRAVGLLLAVVNGERYSFPTGRGAEVLQVAEAAAASPLRSEFSKYVKAAMQDPKQLMALFFPQDGRKPGLSLAVDLLKKVKLSSTIEFHDKGIRLGYKRVFPNLPTALKYGLLLLLDTSQPYSRALSQCRLTSCGRFYLAKKNPKGGPANRNYCSEEHRSEAHNKKQNRSPRKSK